MSTNTYTPHSDTFRIRIYVHSIPFNWQTKKRKKASLREGNIKRIIVTKLVINFQLISSRRSVIFSLKFISNALSWCSASFVAPFLDFSIHFVYFFFLFIRSFHFNILLLANFVDESVSISHFWMKLGDAKS